jgi:glucosamine-phosphate N-acetyltransferase
MEITECTSDIDCSEYLTLLSSLSILDVDSIDPKQFEAHLHTILSNSLHKIFIMKFQNIIIGSITLLIEPKFIHNLSYVGHIEDVVVDAKFRNLGIGKLLVDHAIQYGKSASCYKIILDCDDTLKKFYGKLGFTPKDEHMALYF